jgi:predicted MFS family arabinose efflux permease
MVAALCVLYYSAIFPFQKFAVPMLQNTLGISAQSAADIFAWFPIGAMVLTPLLGLYLDFKGKGATMLILGAILMGACHLTFALVPLTKTIAYIALILLGVSFSLVPAALWPSVPKLVEERYLGSGYSVIFWIQNIGLWGFPIIIGATLQAANPGVSEQIRAGAEVTYNYAVPMLIFASLGVLAFLLGLWLKVLDKKKGFGLELPNVKS